MKFRLAASVFMTTVVIPKMLMKEKFCWMNVWLRRGAGALMYVMFSPSELPVVIKQA